MKLRSIALNLTALALAAGLAACSDNEDTFSLSGGGIKGPVFGATVKVYSLSTSTATEVNAACSTTADDGSYTCDIPTSAKGPFKVEMSGGQYCSNEKKVSQCVANGGTIKSLGAEKLSTIAVANSTGAIQAAPITPFTTAAVAAAGANASSFVSKYVAIATNLGINPNPTAAPDLSNNTRSKELLVAISSSATSLSTIVTAVQAVSAPIDNLNDIGLTAAAITPNNTETSTLPPSGLGVVTEVTGTTGATTGAVTGSSS
jgi:hypothetical protein